MGLQIVPKRRQKSIKNNLMPTCPQETTPRGPKTAPRGPQRLLRGSKITPSGPKTVPIGPKIAPRLSQEAPRSPQEAPKTSQAALRMDPEALVGRISPPSNLLPKYSQSHLVHYTNMYCKFSRNYQKDPKIVQDQHWGLRAF